MSRIKIGVLGSCGNRDIFNSQINPNYKKDFIINYSHVNDSIINIMAKPINYSQDDLLDLNGNKLDKASNIFIKQILDRNLTQKLFNGDVDYLLLDFYLEIFHGMYLLDDNVLYNSPYLKKCKFYTKIKDKKIISMNTDMDLYFNMFKESFEKFYSMMEKELPNITLILSPIRESYKIQQNNDGIQVNTQYKNSKINYYSSIIEEWVLNNYEIESLMLKRRYNLSPNHQWGLGPTHYIPEYYKNKTQEIKKVVKRIESLKKYEKLNKNIKLTKNRYNLSKMEKNIIKNEITDHEEFIYKHNQLEEKIMYTNYEYNNLKQEYHEILQKK